MLHIVSSLHFLVCLIDFFLFQTSKHVIERLCIQKLVFKSTCINLALFIVSFISNQEKRKFFIGFLRFISRVKYVQFFSLLCNTDGVTLSVGIHSEDFSNGLYILTCEKLKQRGSKMLVQITWDSARAFCGIRLPPGKDSILPSLSLRYTVMFHIPRELNAAINKKHNCLLKCIPSFLKVEGRLLLQCILCV